jgi:hypothetical protein
MDELCFSLVDERKDKSDLCDYKHIPYLFLVTLNH